MSSTKDDLNKSKATIVDEIHRQSRKNFIRRHVLQKGINDTLQVDLVEMLPYAKINGGMKYILTCVDIFSKVAYARPLKNKTATETANAMESILQQIGEPPKNIQSDQGKEFYGKPFQQLMKSYKINHYSTYTHLKASIVERFNRTFKSWMYKYLHYHGSYKWTDLLEKLLNKYNNHFHRTIKMSPNQVNATTEKLLLNSIYNYSHVKQKPKYSVGDKVRISKYKNVFSKSYEGNFTAEIFTIYKVQPTSPITYLLKDFEDNLISGAFYEPELQKTKEPDVFLIEKILKRKPGKMYVKWEGYPESKNSWISSEK